MKLAFYIHIPYCIKRCGYCDFNTYTPAELKINSKVSEISKSYIDSALNEIELAETKLNQKVDVSSIFFGGGTPPLMEPTDISRVITKISKSFNLSNDAEVTLEVNPDSVDKIKLESFFEILVITL